MMNFVRHAEFWFFRLVWKVGIVHQLVSFELPEHSGSCVKCWRRLCGTAGQSMSCSQCQGVWQDWGIQKEVAYELPEDNWDTRCGGPEVKFLTELVWTFLKLLADILRITVAADCLVHTQWNTAPYLTLCVKQNHSVSCTWSSECANE